MITHFMVISYSQFPYNRCEGIEFACSAHDESLKFIHCYEEFSHCSQWLHIHICTVTLTDLIWVTGQVLAIGSWCHMLICGSHILWRSGSDHEAKGVQMREPSMLSGGSDANSYSKVTALVWMCCHSEWHKNSWQICLRGSLRDQMHKYYTWTLRRITCKAHKNLIIETAL